MVDASDLQVGHPEFGAPKMTTQFEPSDQPAQTDAYPIHNNYPDPFKIPPANRISHPGSQVLYRDASGMEKAWADVEAERSMDTYAEAVIDVWNPWQISFQHLPFLASAMGVNLYVHILS